MGYNPDQPRDDHGRFGEGNAGGGAALAAARLRAVAATRAASNATKKAHVREDTGTPLAGARKAVTAHLAAAEAHRAIGNHEVAYAHTSAAEAHKAVIGAASASRSDPRRADANIKRAEEAHGKAEQHAATALAGAKASHDFQAKDPIKEVGHLAGDAQRHKGLSGNVNATEHGEKAGALGAEKSASVESLRASVQAAKLTRLANGNLGSNPAPATAVARHNAAAAAHDHAAHEYKKTGDHVMASAHAASADKHRDAINKINEKPAQKDESTKGGDGPSDKFAESEPKSAEVAPEKTVEVRATIVSKKASRATDDARTDEDHARAERLHGKAADLHEQAGNHDVAKEHRRAANAHADVQHLRDTRGEFPNHEGQLRNARNAAKRHSTAARDLQKPA